MPSTARIHAIARSWKNGNDMYRYHNHLLIVAARANQPSWKKQE